MDRWNINLLDDGNLNWYGRLIKIEDATPYMLSQMKQLQEINKIPINNNCKFINDREKYLYMGFGAIQTNPETGEKIRMCNWDGCHSCPMKKNIMFNKDKILKSVYFWYEKQDNFRGFFNKFIPKYSTWLKYDISNTKNKVKYANSFSVRIWANLKGWINDPEDIKEDELKKIVADNGFTFALAM